MSSGHYCDGCAQAYYKCVCNKPQEKVKEQTIKMNERIKQLAEKARHWAHFKGLEQNPTSSPDSLFEKKFAELIVRECAKEAFEFWCNQLDCNEDSAQSHIKKHFGVEE